MNLPRKKKQWTVEISAAIQNAITLAEAESGDLTAEAKIHLYKYAAIFAARNRAEKNKARIQDAARYAALQRTLDFKIDPDCRNNYEINFMLAYLDAHIFLELISERKMDNIMDHLVDHYSFCLKDDRI